jgi:general secretion pathway protein F
MTAFQYRAVTADNNPAAGVIDAADAVAATRQLIDRGLYPLEVAPGRRRIAALLSLQVGRKSPTGPELAQFLGDLGNLLSAGVELAPALGLVAATIGTPRIRKLAEGLRDEVRNGASLSQAMRASKTPLPVHLVALVRAAELSGALGNGLLLAGDAQRRSAALYAQLRTALIYPAFLAVALTLAIVVLIGVVVPAIEDMLGGNLARVSWSTRLVIAAGHLLRDHVTVLALLALALPVALALALRRRALRAKIERVLLRLPGLGGLIIAAESARIASLLALMSLAGVPLADALELSRSGGRMVISELALTDATLKLRRGVALADALASVPTITPRTLALIQIGEAAGRLGAMLQQAAQDAERRVASAIERFLALLTPVMTLVFGAIAGFVLYAIMTSILSINEFTRVS